MITNNFKKILTLIFSSTSTGSDSPKIPNTNFTNLPKFVAIDGAERQMNNQEGYESAQNFLYNMMNHMEKTTSSAIGNLYMKVGTGTTAPTENDYELNNINTDVSCDSVVAGSSANYTKTYTAIFSNPTTSDITVTEVGLYGKVCYDSRSSYYMIVLLARTVLDTPITIPAGESKAITYELGF
jgi:hypothetical protein